MTDQSSFDIRLALRGEHERYYTAVGFVTLAALTDAAIDVGEHAQGELRKDTESGGLGRRVANAWRLQMFPDGAERRRRSNRAGAALGQLPKSWREVGSFKGLSRSPVAFLYSRAPHIIEAFEKGETIGGGPGAPIAIPIPGSPADELKNPRGPDTKVDAARAKFGELDIIPGNGVRPAMLVISNARFSKTGRVSQARLTKTGKYRKGAVSVPIFWLVPNAHLRKRVNVARVRHHAERRSTARLEHYLNKHMNSPAVLALLEGA